MGRAKTYSRDTLVERAMELFWSHGFQGTSTADLVEHLGVNRYSVYAEFGSKQGLFRAAMALYQRRVTLRFRELEGPSAGLDEIAALLDFLATEAAEPWAGRGCFLCNVATECAPHDDSSRDFVHGYVDGIRGAFLNALSNAQARGDLEPGVSCEDHSHMLTSTVLGFWVLMRARVDHGLLVGAARAAREQLDRLRV